MIFPGLTVHRPAEFAQVQKPGRLCRCCEDVSGIVEGGGKRVSRPQVRYQESSHAMALTIRSLSVIDSMTMSAPTPE